MIFLIKSYSYFSYTNQKKVGQEKFIKFIKYFREVKILIEV